MGRRISNRSASRGECSLGGWVCKKYTKKIPFGKKNDAHEHY